MPSEIAQIGSIGFEFEHEDCRIAHIQDLRYNNIRLSNDASCEKSLPTLFGRPVNLVNIPADFPTFSPENYGGELISGIFEDDDDDRILNTLKNICRILKENGETEQSYRAGFHVHVNCPFNLNILKSVLRLGRHLEQVFFLLGGMGYDYRGTKNDSCYCRPITKWGPLVVPVGNNRFGQVFNLDIVLNSTKVTEFWEKFGDLNNFRGNRHAPVRYHWLNLKPILNQGSVEFRIFNKSLNPYYLFSIIKLCKSFVGVALKYNFKGLKELDFLKENSVFDIEDRDYIFNTFMEFVPQTLLSESEVQTLLEIMEKSNFDVLKNIEKRYVFTHLMFTSSMHTNSHFRETLYVPEPIKKSEIKEPNFVDSHRLNNNGIGNIIRNTRLSSFFISNTSSDDYPLLEEELEEENYEDEEDYDEEEN